MKKHNQGIETKRTMDLEHSRKFAESQKKAIRDKEARLRGEGPSSSSPQLAGAAGMKEIGNIIDASSSPTNPNNTSIVL
jgi:hypothetical protein